MGEMNGASDVTQHCLNAGTRMQQILIRANFLRSAPQEVKVCVQKGVEPQQPLYKQPRRKSTKKMSTLGDQARKKEYASSPNPFIAAFTSPGTRHREQDLLTSSGLKKGNAP